MDSLTEIEFISNITIYKNIHILLSFETNLNTIQINLNNY